ncbi:Acyl carrier protein [Legionella wadsworthii]|uniref:Acyl carrier protein n=1 Tax=Legionella wadsworthii TaxID=28088 RepID=A0A378LUE0_9GAMM|nr:phosphopantetheine-binding protein [Legionella wadsworthii]STY31204.1 Acyl carrier protein [Legionella wadsworthii]
MQASLEDIKGISAEIFQTVDVHKIEEDLSFSEAGLDSLDAFTLLMKVEEKYGFSIPEKDVNQIKTFKDLIEYSNNKLTK